jgi:hypothetical protein
MTPLYRGAIKSIESSGGKYDLLGPVTNSGDRAYGAYQVMGNNIPEWTQKHLGKAMTPEEFLASPDAQDTVFDKQFGSYVQKYGNPQDAASAWFTGGPLASGANKRDILGTSGSGYVDKFNKFVAANGDNPTAAINSAAGINSVGPGAMTSAFAAPEDAGALNTKNVLGAGALSTGAPEVDKASVIGQGLSGIGASLAGISSPAQAAAITQQAALMKKAQTDNGSWSVHILPNGQVMRINSKTNATQILPGNYAKAEDTPKEIERQKLEAKNEDARYTTTQDAVGAADEALSTIKQLRAAVQNKDVTFGGLGNSAATAKNIAYSLGMDVKGLTDTQIVEKLSTQMQLAKGKLLPGAISNYEDQLMGKANGLGLDKSREANLASLDALEALHNHTKTLAAAARDYKKAHGALDDGWDAYRTQYAPATPTTTSVPPAATVPAKPMGTFKTKSGISYSY